MEQEKSGEGDQPHRNPEVILKDTFNNSRSSDNAASVMEGSSEHRTSQESGNYSEEHQEQENEEGLLDLSKREDHNSAEYISSETEFVVLAPGDDDDDDHMEEIQGQDESLDASEDSPAASSQGSGANPSTNFYKCSMCDKIFYNQQRLLLHMNKHMGVKPYACPLCPANFNSMASLQRHRRSHKTTSANLMMHTCSQCHAQFSNSQHLTEHMKIHAEKRSCLHCGIFVGGMRSLQKHMAAEHPYIVRPVKKSRIAGIHARGFPQAGNKKHSSAASNKPVVCRQCGRQFQTTSALHGHMKGHSKLYQWKPRKCRCGILLADEAEYQRHLKYSNCNPGPSSQPMGSPATLSPVSPLNVSPGMAFAASGQSGVRSRSLDSGLKSPPYTTNTYIPISSSASYAGVAPRDLVAISRLRDVDNDSSVSKDTVSSVTMSERSSGSPIERVLIKTEEEWNVVDAGQMATNENSIEDTRRDFDQSQSRREQLTMMASQLPAQLRVHPIGESVEIEGQSDRHRENSVPALERQAINTEATSSSQGFARSEPQIMRISSYPRTSSESPGMQISSSQSGHPVPSSLLSPAQMVQPAPDETPWRCSYCGISFEDSLMYVIHKGCHEPTSPFKCSMCGEQCGDKVAFMLHFVRGEHKKPTHV